MTEELSLPNLQEACWTVTELEGLQDLLARTAGDRTWQGIAYTTAGARALRSATPEVLSSTDGEKVALDTVYELRLWATVDPPRSTESKGSAEPEGSAKPEGSAEPAGSAPGSVLARELRWVNDLGATEVVVSTARCEQPAGPWKPCWYRRNSYLQHGANAPDGETHEMTSIEIFTAEEKYGNVVFTDELMTGRWN